jgi:hypothetical protein
MGKKSPPLIALKNRRSPVPLPGNLSSPLPLSINTSRAMELSPPYRSSPPLSHSPCSPTPSPEFTHTVAGVRPHHRRSFVDRAAPPEPPDAEPLPFSTRPTPPGRTLPLHTSKLKVEIHAYVHYGFYVFSKSLFDSVCEFYIYCVVI